MEFVLTFLAAGALNLLLRSPFSMLVGCLGWPVVWLGFRAGLLGPPAAEWQALALALCAAGVGGSVLGFALGRWRFGAVGGS